jgi:hypothetical protein
MIDLANNALLKKPKTLAEIKEKYNLSHDDEAFFH